MFHLPRYKAVLCVAPCSLVIWLVCYLDEWLVNPVSIFLSRW